MSSDSVCQVALSWVDVGSFHTRLFGVVYVTCGVSPEYFAYTHVYSLGHFSVGQGNSCHIAYRVLSLIENA
jgi:hypothetical protein